MIKTVEKIKDEFYDNGRLSKQSMQDLAWHLENDKLPHSAISLVTDARIMELAPLMAKHLDHEDDFIRERTVGCVVGRMRMAEYAEKALQMAIDDPEEGPRALAISSLGAVINKVDSLLKKRIAGHICEVFVDSKYDEIDRDCAFQSILTALEVPIDTWHKLKDYEREHYIREFKTKYDI
jgi:hypothetical protein